MSTQVGLTILGRCGQGANDPAWSSERVAELGVGKLPAPRGAPEVSPGGVSALAAEAD